MDYIQLISAAGIGGIIGSLLTAAAQAWFSHKSYLANRNFNEKKEAYIGYLQAMHESELKQTDEAAKNVGHWRHRCELVASKEVILAIDKFFRSNPINGNIHPDRPNALRELKDAMRKDLGVHI